MPRFRVRRAALADLGLLVTHRRKMFEEMGEGTRARRDAHDARYRRWARARLASGRLVGFVAEAGGRAVGSGCVWMQEAQPSPYFEDARRPYLLSMWTEVDWRGRGVASAIVRAAIQWSRREGASRLTLHASEAGRAVYARLGFARTWEMRLALKPPRGPRLRGSGRGASRRSSRRG